MKPEDIELLIDQCLDGVADEEAHRRLQELLLEHDDLRAQYVRACALREDVAELHAHPGDRLIQRRSHATGLAIGALLALAASLMLAVGFWPSADPGPVADPGESVGQQEDQLQGIARIERRINCVLSDGEWSIESSPFVFAGQTIGLERGFLQVRYHNGVSLVLEGPAEFTAIDQLSGVLEFGGIGVRVPDGFSGYIVDTLTARVVDLGTEFAVRVGDDGSTKLRVVEGEVSVSERNKNGELSTEQPQLLKKDATWTSMASLKAPKGPPAPRDFPSVSLLEDPGFDATPPLPVTEGLELWFAADVAVKRDGKGRIISWGDISSSDPAKRHSAWQVEAHRRPSLAATGIGVMPSIHFDGVDDCLITEPFATGDAQTIVVVAQLDKLRGKSNSIPAHQFINYNGPPHLVVEYRWPQHALRTRAFAGYGHTPEHAGKIKAGGIKAKQPLALIYTYDHPKNVATLRVNGRTVDSAKATLPVANDRPKVLGLHRRLDAGALLGDIAEVLIYDRSVSEDEVASINAYLVDRYGEFAALTQSPKQ